MENQNLHIKPRITIRETQTLSLIADEHCSKEIANNLLRHFKALFVLNIIFFLILIPDSAMAQVPNDNCASATLLPFCNTQTSTNVNAMDSGTDHSNCGSTYAGGDVWFSFVAPASGTVSITISEDDNDVVDDLELFEGCTNTQVACFANITQNGTVSFTGLTSGQDYRLAVWEQDNNAFGTFKIRAIDANPPNNPSQFIGTNNTRGDQLRVYKLAVSTTAEATAFMGGAAAAQIEINSVVDQINEIYGRELSVRFELIPNNSSLIFTNAANDPWPTLAADAGGCGGLTSFLNIQKTVFESNIGAANYDISHVILQYPNGGVAGCASYFDFGVSSANGLFEVMRHEIGHQFTAPHTINNCSNNNFELTNDPNRSIMGGNNSPFFHATSYHVMANRVNSGSEGTDFATGNSIPQISVGPDMTIPTNTPFVIEADVSDADGDVLKLTWDNMDRAVEHAIPSSVPDQGALFGRKTPSTIPYRNFPHIGTVINGMTSNATEQLPTVNRDMDFRVTVQDDHTFTHNGQTVPANGVNSDDIKITVFDTGAPFKVTSQNTPGVSYPGGSTQTVTWDVSGTNLAPFNVSNVKISLSLNGGDTFPIVLNSSTPNDGIAQVTIPFTPLTVARIKVEAIGNIFFNMNLENITITGGIPNDLCTGAMPITCGSTVQGITVGANLSVSPNCFTNGVSDFFSRSLWYSFVGDGSEITASTCSSPDTDEFDALMYLYSGDCNGTLICETHADDDCGLFPELTFTTVAGQQYYMMVGGFDTNEVGFVELTLTSNIENDSCADAIPLSCGDVVTGNTTCAGISVTPNCFSGGVSDFFSKSLWYSFIGNGGSITASTCNSSNTNAFDALMYLYTGDCNGTLACETLGDDDCGLFPELTFTTVAGQQYYIMVGGFDLNEVGEFELSFSADPIVTNSNDDGPGSLRYAIACASPNDVITFDPSTNGNPIMLTGPQIVIDKPLSFEGNGEDATIIDGIGNDAVRLMSINSGAPCHFRDMRFQNGGGANFTSFGGAIYFFADTKFTNCTFNNNMASNGGAIASAFCGATITGCEFYENTSNAQGGAMDLFPQPNHSSTITNTLIHHNTATTFGGGIHHYGNTTGGLYLYNNTIANNTTNSGVGGVQNSNSIINMMNNIIANNSGATPDLGGIGSISNVQKNIISDLTGSGLNASTDANPVDPNFVDAANYDYHLASPSPGINAGNNSNIQADICDVDGDGDVAEVYPFDLDGAVRVLHGNVDLGALETDEACDITTDGLTIINCNDQGTADPSDDTYTFQLDPTGNGLGFQYDLSGGIAGSTATYGLPVTFTRPISLGPITYTITDKSGGCTFEGTVTPPASCSIPDLCDNKLQANCGQTIVNHTGDIFNFDDGCEFFGISGGFRLYEFTPIESGDVDIRLFSFAADKDLYIFTNACDASCNDIAGSTAFGTTEEFITLSAVAGTTYDIVVLDFAEDGGQFSLSIDCTDPCEEDITLDSPDDDFLGGAFIVATNKSIFATNKITGVSSVDYSAGTTSGESINLNAGFEVGSGALFHAYMDGCGISAREEE